MPPDAISHCSDAVLSKRPVIRLGQSVMLSGSEQIQAHSVPTHMRAAFEAADKETAENRACITGKLRAF